MAWNNHILSTDTILQNESVLVKPTRIPTLSLESKDKEVLYDMVTINCAQRNNILNLRSQLQQAVELFC